MKERHDRLATEPAAPDGEWAIHDVMRAVAFKWPCRAACIPRHLRDLVVTEYGIADLSGKSDKEVIAALLNVTDSRFQDDLTTRAKRAGKLPQDYRIPDSFRNNLPERPGNRVCSRPFPSARTSPPRRSCSVRR